MITRDFTVRQEKPSYPYIGEGKKGCVVLFTSKNKGIVLVQGNDCFEVGTTEDDWLEKENFKVVPELTLISK